MIKINQGDLLKKYQEKKKGKIWEQKFCTLVGTALKNPPLKSVFY